MVGLQYCVSFRCTAKGFSQTTCMEVQLLSHVRLFAIPWTVTHQALLSIGFSRQEYCLGCHFLLQGLFQTWGLNPGILLQEADSFTTEPPGKPSCVCVCVCVCVFLFRFLCFIDYYNILNIVPSATYQVVLFLYFIYSSVYVLMPNS